MKNSTEQGFTLMEVLVVVAIIGILASIAYPSYSDRIKKARRMDAKVVLMKAILEQEHRRMSNPIYALQMSQLGLDSSNDYYDFSISNATKNTYTITATAKSGTTQASDLQGSLDCSVISVTQSEDKTPAACWD